MSKLQCLYDWFDTYTRSFYTHDQSVMSGILLKEKHSLRVAKNAADLAVSLLLSDDKQEMAEAAGLLHDIARYDQWTQFHSFNDVTTKFDHGEVGAEKLNNIGILKDIFNRHEQEVILFAIRYHNQMLVPEEGADYQLFANILRDSDKLDILRSLAPIQGEHDYSPVLIQCLQAGGPLPYSEAKTPGDYRLLRVGWLNDVNFPWTFTQLMQEGYVEQALASLPDVVPFDAIKHKFQQHIAQKLYGI